MLRVVESGRKRYLGFRPLQNPDSRSEPLHAVLSLQVKHCALAALLHPESIRRNIETDTLPIISDFHGSGSACDSTGTMEIRNDGKRSEEHTSELQSHLNLVCRLLLEKKKK